MNPFWIGFYGTLGILAAILVIFAILIFGYIIQIFLKSIYVVVQGQRYKR